APVPTFLPDRTLVISMPQCERIAAWFDSLHPLQFLLFFPIEPSLFQCRNASALRRGSIPFTRSTGLAQISRNGFAADCGMSAFAGHRSLLSIGWPFPGAV